MHRVAVLALDERRRVRPRDPGPGLRHERASATPYAVCGAARPARSPRRRASRRRRRTASRRSPRADTVIVPGLRHRAWPPPAAVLDALRAAARPRRAHGLDLHRRLRPRRTPACSTAAGPPPTGRSPSGSPSLPGRRRSTRRALRRRGRRADLGRRRRRASTSACTSCAATTAPTVGERGRPADRRRAAPRGRPGAVRRAPAAARPSGAARRRPALGARAPRASRSTSPRWRATPAYSPRTFARRFRAETGTTPLQWLLAPARAGARRLLEELRPAGRGRRRRAPASARAASLRKHFRRATATTPRAYRRSFRGSPA